MPRKVMEFKSKIRNTDAIIIATPEYNYSVPGVSKNAIDFASRPYGDNPFDGKTSCDNECIHWYVEWCPSPVSFTSDVCVFEYVSNQQSRSNSYIRAF